MLAENCCYYRQNLVVLQMVRAGLFGDLTFAECDYVHDCRNYLFDAAGKLTWRGEMARDLIGNWMPSGPAARRQSTPAMLPPGARSCRSQPPPSAPPRRSPTSPGARGGSALADKVRNTLPQFDRFSVTSRGFSGAYGLI